MERFPWHPKLRHTVISRPLVIAAVSALGLAVLAAAGMAATNRSSAAPSNTQPPVVSGTPGGKTLSTTNGTWSGTTPLTFSHQWRRCDKTGGSCANISGATNNTYPVQGAEADHLGPRQNQLQRLDREQDGPGQDRPARSAGSSVAHGGDDHGHGEGEQRVRVRAVHRFQAVAAAEEAGGRPGLADGQAHQHRRFDLQRHQRTGSTSGRASPWGHCAPGLPEGRVRS